MQRDAVELLPAALGGRPARQDEQPGGSGSAGEQCATG